MVFVPKLVALDIDGTILNSSGELRDEMYDSVQRVVAAGVPVVLSTGRSWYATKDIFEMLDLPAGWAVCSNGAIVVTNPPLEIKHEVLFDPAETIEKVVRLLPTARLCAERSMVYYVSQPFPEGELQGEVKVASIAELSSQPVTRLVVREPEKDDEEVFEQLTGVLSMHDVSHFVGWSAWLDITAKGIDKASGLGVVVENLGLEAKDVLAIGDGRNDLEMLRWAGRGVAMGSASAEVQAGADAITGDVDSCGAARELDRWFR